jgi:hypothetical protein
MPSLDLLCNLLRAEREKSDIHVHASKIDLAYQGHSMRASGSSVACKATLNHEVSRANVHDNVIKGYLNPKLESLLPNETERQIINIATRRSGSRVECQT